jgi:hypothetical protein
MSPPRPDNSRAATNPPKREQIVSDPQVKRLIKLAKNFDEAVEVLPNEKGKQYKREQKELADNRRQAQMSEGLLRLRVR